MGSQVVLQLRPPADEPPYRLHTPEDRHSTATVQPIQLQVLTVKITTDPADSSRMGPTSLWGLKLSSQLTMDYQANTITDYNPNCSSLAH